MKKTPMNEMSNMPAGGMTRRNGARTGSVRSRRICVTNANGVPRRGGGNHDVTARAKSTTR